MSLVEFDPSYLTTQTTREEAERRIDFAHASREFREDWERLLNKALPDDELWNFEPPSKQHIAAWGVALVRSGKIIATLIEAID